MTDTTTVSFPAGFTPLSTASPGTVLLADNGSNGTVTVAQIVAAAVQAVGSNTGSGSGTTTTPTVDPNAVFFNWEPAQLTHWRLAAARVAAGVPGARAKIVCLGDSTTFGVGSSNGVLNAARANGYPAQLAAKLAGFIPTLGRSSCLGGYADNSDPRITFGGGAAYTGIQNAAGQVPKLSAVGDTITYTLDPGYYDRVDIYYMNYGSNVSFAVSVDGAAPVTITPDKTEASLAMTTLTIPAGFHSVVTFSALNSNGAFVDGVAFWNSQSPAVEVYNFGQPGADSAGIASGAPVGTGYQSMAMTGLAAPDLLIVNIGINDINNGTETAAQTIANIKPLIESIKGLGASIVLCVPQPFSSANYATGIVALRSALQAFATAEGLGLVDLSNLLGNAVTQALWFDSLHPNGALYGFLAGFFAEIARPPGSVTRVSQTVAASLSASGSLSIAYPASGDQTVSLALSGDTTLTVTGGAAGQAQTLTLVVTPNGHTLTLPANSASFMWQGGTAPTLSTTKTSIIHLTQVSSAGVIYAGSV